MKTFFRLILVALNCSNCGAADLPRSQPEEQGVSSADVLDFIEAVDKALILETVRTGASGIARGERVLRV